MPVKDTYTIGIIGAGISGLTAGALLAKQGHRVLVFEKESCLGGRALSFDAGSLSVQEYRELLARFQMHLAYSEPDLSTIISQHRLAGYTLDLGYHAIGGGVLSNLNDVFRQLDDHIETYESAVGYIHQGGYDFPFLSRGDKLRILPNILKLLLAGERTMRKLDEVSITQTIDRYGKGKMKHILEVFSRSISTVNNLDRISTGEMFRAQRNLLRGSKPVGYPKNGLGAISRKLADAITRSGGTVELNAPVKRIITEGGSVTGLQVGDRTVPCDIVVSSMLVQDLFSVIDERLFPASYVSMMKALTGTGSLCVYYALDDVPRELQGKTFHFLERGLGVDGNDAVGMIDLMSAMPDSGLSPAKQYLVQAYIICTPGEARDPQMLEKLRRSLDTNFERLIPHYKEHLLWALYPAVHHLDGVAKTIDNPKPEIITPVQNLFLIGDCVKAPGIGINCAINSAKVVTEMIQTKQYSQ